MPAAVSPFIHGAALGILSFFSVRVTNALSSGPTLYLGAVFVQVRRSCVGDNRPGMRVGDGRPGDVRSVDVGAARVWGVLLGSNKF